MKSLFKALPLERKLGLIAMIPLAVVSLLFLLATTIGQANKQRAALIEQSSSLTSILSRNVGAAVLFKDQDAAQSLLESLHYATSILYAQVKSTDASYQVEYRKDGNTQSWSKIVLDEARFGGPVEFLSGYLVTSRPVRIDGEKIGVLVLVSDTRPIFYSITRFVVLFVLLIIASSLLAFMLVRKLRRSISGPVQVLSDAMQTVSRDNNYSIRVGEPDERDIRVLYRGFDHMLDQIEHREEELGKYRHSLEKQVAERTAEIENINIRRITWLENMAFFLHHELRNKIVGFRSTLDIIERKATAVELEKYLYRARKSATLMNHLLQSIGNASDLEAALYTESKQPLSLSLLVNEQVQEYNSSYPEQNFQAHIEVGIMVSGNHERIIQALDKLISNAVEHSHENSPISLRLTSEDNQAVLEVINTGDALPENLEEIFEVFVSSKLNRSENRGLGLFVVKLIVDNHSGEVSVIALEKEQGARFIIRLPLYFKTGDEL